MSVLSIVEWVIWGIVLACGLWFAIGIRTAATQGAYPPTWPTLIISFYLVILPVIFLFLEFSKIHIVWILFIIWSISLRASFIHVPIISKLLIWPAYIYACIVMIGTGSSLTSPSRQSPWAARTIRKTPQDLDNCGNKNSIEKDNVDFLYEKLWQEGLSEIVPKITAKEIATDFLIPNKIDPFAFAYNYEVFLRKGMLSFEATFFPNEGQSSHTASITEAASPLRHIPSFPDWFIAACPDVFLWFSNFQRERVKNRRKNDDVNAIMANLIIELFGFTSEDTSLEISNVKDEDDKWLPKWLNNLAASYKRKTGKSLETSLVETKNNLIMEFYENIDVAQSMSKAGIDTFTIIARKTTMYYLELSKNYRQRFSNEACLLATAGVFDTQVYIFMNKNIEISEIVELAEKVVADENDLLTEFIVRLEAKMFTVDTPELTQEMVENSCQEEKPRIHKEIQRVRKEYKRDPFIAKEVQAFMESPNFSEMRDQLGIR